MATRALIIGGAGFLGTNLAHRLCGEYEVTVVDSLDPKLRGSTAGLRTIEDRIRFIQADMRDAAAMREAVAGQQVIFNCAGQTSHPISMREPTYDAELNCIGHLTVLEAMREMNRDAVIVYTSTSTVTGKATTEIDETHAELPLDIYSANKLAAEKYYRIYHTAHGLKTIALRFANLYGPFGKGFPEFGFVNYFISLAASGQQIKIFGEGQQTRNLLFARDACEAMIAASRESRLYGQAMFATHDEHLSVREIARAVVETFGGSVTHVEWPEDRKRIEVDDVHISSARLRSVTSWRPQTSFRDGLAITKRVMGS
jgi:UDP-glucose 4-epimerase